MATASAADLFPVAQLDTRAVAAASGLGLNVFGRATVVVVRDARDVVVVAAPCACVVDDPPVGRKWTYTSPSKLRAKTPITMPIAILRGPLSGC
jgi:hypothetical protein